MTIIIAVLGDVNASIPATRHPGIAKELAVSQNAFVHPGQVRKVAQLPRVFRWFSDHCVLRQVDAADVSRIWKAVIHPAFAQCWNQPSPRSQAEVAALLLSAQADWRSGTRYTIAVERKQTHEFVGVIEAREVRQRLNAWQLDWFFHPQFMSDSVSFEAVAAVSELLFSTLGAQLLYAECPPAHAGFEKLLNDVGFIQLVPAGSLDPDTRQPRLQALYELNRAAWETIRAQQDEQGAPSLWPSTKPKLELSLL